MTPAVGEHDRHLADGKRPIPLTTTARSLGHGARPVPQLVAVTRDADQAAWDSLGVERLVLLPDLPPAPPSTLPTITPSPAVAVTVLAPRPAAGPALAFLQLLPSPPNAALSGRLLLGILDPADELVASQRRDVLPGIECRGVRDQRPTQVRGQFMHHPTGHLLSRHRPIGHRPIVVSWQRADAVRSCAPKIDRTACSRRAAWQQPALQPLETRRWRRASETTLKSRKCALELRRAGHRRHLDRRPEAPVYRQRRLGPKVWPGTPSAAGGRVHLIVIGAAHPDRMPSVRFPGHRESLRDHGSRSSEDHSPVLVSVR